LWRQLCSSLELARNDDDDIVPVAKKNNTFLYFNLYAVLCAKACDVQDCPYVDTLADYLC